MNAIYKVIENAPIEEKAAAMSAAFFIIHNHGGFNDEEIDSITNILSNAYERQKSDVAKNIIEGVLK